MEQTVWQILIFCINTFYFPPPSPPLSVGLIFHSPHDFFFFLLLSRRRWWILCCSSSNVQGEAPEIGAGKGRGGGGCRSGRELSGRMLCRSMKNCTGILPPQLTVLEADLISAESIRLELWEITLLKITLVTSVEAPDPCGSILPVNTSRLSKFLQHLTMGSEDVTFRETIKGSLVKGCMCKNINMPCFGFYLCLYYGTSVII